jgi:tetratricopeptide (TPR) repeat protein
MRAFMKKTVVLTIVIAGAVAGLAVAWFTVRQDQEFRRLLAEGDAALRRDQSFAAIEAFSGALALRPESMLAHVKRGDAYRQRGELDRALGDLQRAAALDPSATRPRELLGDVTLAMGRLDQAIQEYRAYVALDDRPHVLYKLAFAYYRNGQTAAALAPLQQSLALDGRFAEAHYLLGLCQRPSSTAEAKASLERAIAIQPSFLAAREELARMLLDEGETAAAVEHLEELAALEPRAERAVAAGLALARTGRPEAAIVRLGRAAQRYREEPGVYAALGRVWLDIAEARRDGVALNKAREALEVSAAAASPASEHLTLYGRAQLLSGDVKGAERTLETAVARFPVEPHAFLYLSRATARLGRLDRSRAALARYHALSTEDVTASASSQDPARP